MRMLTTSAKLLTFMVVTTVAGLGVATVAGNMRFGPTTSYSAVFTNASGLSNGSDVRVAGVPLGKVESVRLHDDGHALVTFDLSTRRPLTTATTAAIRYKNLIGDRYLDLSEGEGDSRPLSDGRIPVSQTTPALDLDQVVNGFRPLLQGLDPEETNRMARSLVQVLNGQHSAVADIVRRAGTITTTLADRDAAIGAVIDNFTVVLNTVQQRGDAFDQLLVSLSQLLEGLDADSAIITSALDRVDGLTAEMSDLLLDSRADLRSDIEGLGHLAAGLNARTDTLNLVLARLPETYRLIGRVAGYGSFVNFFVCGLAIRYGPGVDGQTPMFTSPADRCK
ncbi:MCE family protein [Nocardia higoensis]|uniref:MCE family protein n=1 Tax=Nocardia higoensis TaxID=228599 RepID=UPI0005943ACF|nr:MCE family protein [Nocardia higoensis]